MYKQQVFDISLCQKYEVDKLNKLLTQELCLVCMQSWYYNANVEFKITICKLCKTFKDNEPRLVTLQLPLSQTSTRKLCKSFKVNYRP